METFEMDAERQRAARNAVRERLQRERGNGGAVGMRWRGVAAAVLAMSLAGAAGSVVCTSPIPAAAQLAPRELDNTTHFQATGIEESKLRFAYTRFSEIDKGGAIHLGITKWAEGPSGWGSDPANEFAGKYILSFSNPDFYTHIESI